MRTLPPPLITRTGRIQSWIDEPYGRLPVSCTVFVVEDAMEGKNGIEDSWVFASHALRNGAGCAIHLSKLRPKGEVNSFGLVASGPVSFARIYSTLNEILRRGGAYKNGAVVIHLDACHPDLEEFLTASRQELAWVKRCVDVGPHFIEDLKARGLLDKLLDGIRSGDIWLNKIRHDEHGQRIYGNVCLEVYLRSRGTCLLQHVNLGACREGDLVPAFREGMTQLCELHGRTGVGDTGHYLTPQQDRQVGLGVLGLANLLARMGITYEKLGKALARYSEGVPEYTKADILVANLADAIRAAAVIARQHGMERAFCIAPTANCSYSSKDLRGFTTVPEIAPPIARTEDRDSGTFGVQTVTYPPNVEIAVEVGWENYKAVADGIVALFQETGLFHGYSFNSWSDQVIYDEAFLKDWSQSPQTSLYYALQVQPDTQDKTDVSLAFEDVGFEELEAAPACNENFCAACAE
jgi:hypothetical protein